MDSSMTNSENSLVPALRFKEFKEAWTKKDFGSIVDKAKAKHDPQKSKEEYPCIEMESITKESSILLEIFNSKDQLSIKNKFNKGEVLFGKLRPNLKKYIIAPFDGVCSSEIWVLQGKKLSNEFLFRLIQTNKFYSSTLVTSGSKMPRADWAYISSSIFPFPTLPEQQKIASFLSAIDDKVQQLTKKKALLEDYKKGVMQQLFSGQLRFKDENGNDYPEWEEKFLGEMTERNICYGVVQPGIEDDKGVKFIRGGDVFNGKISKDLRIISKDITDKYKRTYLKGGELIMSLVGYPGETAIVPVELAGANLARQVGLIDLKKEYDTGYIHFYINSAYGKKNLLSKTIGSAQQVINIIDLKKLKVPLPLKEEQQKIARYLSRIDTKIESVNTQITQTQTFKKGLLQQMFV
jgi:type I restriction enzyme S subunit